MCSKSLDFLQRRTDGNDYGYNHKNYDDDMVQNKNLPEAQEYPSLLFYFHLN